MINRYRLFITCLFLSFYLSMSGHTFADDPYFSENWGLNTTKVNNQSSDYSMGKDADGDNKCILNSMQANTQLIENNATGGHLKMHNVIQYALNESQSCRERDSLTLVSLYNFTDGPNWTNIWDLNQPMSTWYRLTLHPDGCVRSVYLKNNNLNGSLPPNLGDLSQLEHLNLIQNNLSGSIPHSITNLSKLKTLKLHFLYLSGEIPDDIGKLQNLEVLTMSGNQLTGSIPSSLGCIESLYTLYVSNNQLTGCFSPSLRSLCAKPNITNNSISLGNSFDADWNSFCNHSEGICDERIDFENYDFCKRQTIITNAYQKFSGVTYNKYTNTFLIINSTPSALYETDVNGKLLRQMNLGGSAISSELTFKDIEGITVISPNLIAIQEEEESNIVFVNLPPRPTSDFLQILYPGPAAVIHFPSLAGTNRGMEGIVYDDCQDVLYFAVEENPENSKPAVYSLKDPLAFVGDTISNPESPFDINQSLNTAGIDNFTDITGLTMTSDGKLLIVSENAHMIVEIDPNSGVITDTMSSKIPKFEKSKLSGITVGPSDDIILTDHNFTSLLYMTTECIADCNDACGDIILANDDYTIDFETDPQYCNSDLPSNTSWSLVDFENTAYYIDAYHIESSPTHDAYLATQCINGYTPELNLPCIDLYNIGQNPILKFDFYTQKVGTHYTVYASNNNGITWKEIWNFNKKIAKEFWTHAIIPLSEYENESIQLKISTQSYKDYNNYVALDNIKVRSLDDCGHCGTRDSLTLVDFYQRTDGPNWTNSWNLNDPISSWHGVELNNDGCVSKLDLADNNLNGGLPHTVNHLFDLEFLNLSDNAVGGSLHHSIKNLQKLKELHIVRTNMRYPLPPQIGDCLNLQVAILAWNKFTGSLPPSIINLSNLVDFRVQQNNLSGCYHPSLKSLCSQYPAWKISNGNNFDVDWDDFCDNDLGVCEIVCEDIFCEPCVTRDSLALVDFYQRMDGSNWTNSWDLNDPISTWHGVELNNDSCVYKLDLANNNLNGALPQTVNHLLDLEFINLSDNAVGGSLHHSIKNLQKLKELHIVRTDMDGAIPIEIGDCLNLQVAILAWNQFTGSLPRSIINLNNLVDFRVQQNNLSGCYHPLLKSLCSQYPAWKISNGNNFDVVWDDFCENNLGTCGADCEDILNLSGTATSGEYYANQELNSTQMVQNGEVNYGAYEEVTLGIGFEVTTEATFSVTIDGCN